MGVQYAKSWFQCKLSILLNHCAKIQTVSLIPIEQSCRLIKYYEHNIAIIISCKQNAVSNSTSARQRQRIS